MFCTECGVKNSQESNFCKQCGHQLNKPTPPISEEQFNSTLPQNEQVGALMERAYSLRVAGNLAGASALCEQALKLSPDSASAHSLLGQIFEQQGETAKAIKEFETVLEHNPASIADRVKLDQLRNGDTVLLKSPQVVVTHPIQNTPPNIFAMLGVGAALVLVGAVAASQFRGGNAPTNETNRPVIQNGVPNTANITPNNGTAPAQNSGVSSGLPGMSVTHGATSTGSLPNTQNAGSPFVSLEQFQRTMNQMKDSRTRPSYPLVNNGSAVTGAQPINPAQVTMPPGANRNSATPIPHNETNSNRTRLVGEDDGVVQNPDTGAYEIAIDMSEKNGKGSNAGTRTANAANTPNNKEGSVKITLAPQNGANTNTSQVMSGASSQARTAISVGKDLKLRGDYNRAISSFRQALTSAGDETGFVYQEIGKCYQDKGDKNSAIVNYEKAISELQKLVESGRGADNARAALRACQTGIKVCKSD